MMFYKEPTLKPPTLYSILNSIVNYGADDPTKIRDLSREGHSKIFNFSYPLAESVNKDDFEISILNKFLTRRINFETVNLFQIRLCSKLNEIMPKYNVLFDNIKDWNIFNDGENLTRTIAEDRNTTAKNQIDTTANTTSSTTSDRRFSNVPQNKLEDIKNGIYMTTYNLDQNDGTQDNVSNSNASSSGTEGHNLTEKWNKTPSDKMDIYLRYQNEIVNIYSMIFRDLEDLFYGLV